MMENNKPFFSAVDIGSTKVVVVIGTHEDQKINILGLGKAENRGMKQGQIVNMDATVQAIQVARDEAELMAGVKISDVRLAVGGEGVVCVPTRGMVAVGTGIVQKSDIESVLHVARALPLPESCQILHTLPVGYTVDGQSEISTPEGMRGVRLEVDALLVTVPKKTTQNATTCIEQAGLKVSSIVLQQMASAEAVVTAEEKDLGVAVVDMGGGTCDIVVYKEGVLSHIGTVPVGGLNFTQDVAVGLKTPLRDAELLKIKYGSSMQDLVDKEEILPIEGLGESKDKTVLRGQLSQILEARAEETLALIFQKLTEWDALKDLGSGLILTGGASQLTGIVELGEFTFDIPVRRGQPMMKSNLRDMQSNPVFATAMGILQSGDHQHSSEKPKRPSGPTMGSRWESFKSKIGKTFSI